MEEQLQNNFGQTQGPSIGVEMEFQLIDLKTMDLTNKVNELIERVGDDPCITPEAFQCSVEIKSNPQRNSEEVKREIQGKIAKLMMHLDPLDIRLCSMGLHPFSKSVAKTTESPRYKYLEESYPYITHHQMPFSTHLHVAMDTSDEAMNVMRRMRILLPVFMAMSASCPYWQDEATGFVSFRHYLLRSGLNSGISPSLNTWRDFLDYYHTAMKAGIIRSIKDIHWDIRPRPDMGTIELRVMDAVPTLGEATALVSLAHTTIHAVKDHKLSELLPNLFREKVPDWAQRENHFQASRLGLDANFILNAHEGMTTVRELTGELIKSLRDIAKEVNEENGLEDALEILKNGPPYKEIKNIYEETNSLQEVVRSTSYSFIQEIGLGH
jgi:carboxylate-amine ligase